MTPVVDQHTGPTAGGLQADRPANVFACSRHDDHTPCQRSGGVWDVASFMKSSLAKTGRIRSGTRPALENNLVCMLEVRQKVVTFITAHLFKPYCFPC